MIIGHSHERKYPKHYKNTAVYERFWSILQLHGGVILQKSIFNFPEKAVRLKCKYGLLFFRSLFNKIFLQNSFCFILIEMMRKKVLSDILSFGINQPVASTWVRIYKWAEIVNFVLYYPKMLIILPKLSISSCFLGSPYCNWCVRASSGQCLLCFGNSL